MAGGDVACHHVPALYQVRGGLPRCPPRRPQHHAQHTYEQASHGHLQLHYCAGHSFCGILCNEQGTRKIFAEALPKPASHCPGWIHKP